MYRAPPSHSIPCEACGRPKSPIASVVCPHCAGGGIQRIQVSEETARRMKADRSRWAWPKPLRAAVFMLAFPVTVPSLVIHWWFAKRWGRIPYVSIMVDGFVMLLFCLAHPMLTVLFVVSLGSTVALLIRATVQRRADTGIFLGYSNMVALPLVFGGILCGVGALLGLPSSWYRSAAESGSASVSDETSVPWLLVGVVGLVLLSLATWRAGQEDEPGFSL